MIERFENAVQIAALTICTGITFYQILGTGHKIWILLFFFYCSWVLGDIYWLAYLFFFGSTPDVSIVSDLSWYASYIFMYMLIRQAAPPEKIGPKCLLPLLGPAFAIGMAVFFMQWGKYVGNVITAGLMGLLLYEVIWRLLSDHQAGNVRFLWITVLVFSLLEYSIWTVSCFFDGETLLNPYYWCDFALSMTFFFFIPAAKKAVSG